MENSQNHAHTPAESDGQNAHAPKAHADASTDSFVVPQITQKQAKRINAPARNMIISMLAMVAILIPVLWLMPQVKCPFQFMSSYLIQQFSTIGSK